MQISPQIITETKFWQCSTQPLRTRSGRSLVLVRLLDGEQLLVCEWKRIRSHPWAAPELTPSLQLNAFVAVGFRACTLWGWLPLSPFGGPIGRWYRPDGQFFLWQPSDFAALASWWSCGWWTCWQCAFCHFLDGRPLWTSSLYRSIALNLTSFPTSNKRAILQWPFPYRNSSKIWTRLLDSLEKHAN